MHKHFNADKFFKKEDLTKKEISWLTKFMKLIFKERLTEDDVYFNELKTEEEVFIILHHELNNFLEEQTISKKFLNNSAITKDVTRDKKDETFFMKIEFLYWFLDKIDDFLDYKDVLDSMYIEVMGGDDKKYDEKKKGYKIFPSHLKKPCKSWKPIEQTLLLGFAIYLGLFQKDSISSLKEIFNGIKDKTIKCFGLTHANKEAFGRTFHYEQLNLCWNCGNPVKTKGKLCKDCNEYWDAKTK